MSFYDIMYSAFLSYTQSTTKKSMPVRNQEPEAIVADFLEAITILPRPPHSCASPLLSRILTEQSSSRNALQYARKTARSAHSGAAIWHADTKQYRRSGALDRHMQVWREREREREREIEIQTQQKISGRQVSRHL